MVDFQKTSIENRPYSFYNDMFNIKYFDKEKSEYAQNII